MYFDEGESVPVGWIFCPLPVSCASSALLSPVLFSRDCRCLHRLPESSRIERLASITFRIVPASVLPRSATNSSSSVRDWRRTDSVNLSSGAPEERFEKPSAMARVYCPSVTADGNIPSERRRPNNLTTSTRRSLDARPHAIIRLEGAR